MSHTIEDFAKKLHEEDWFYQEAIKNMSQSEADDGPKYLLEEVKKEADRRGLSLIEDSWNYSEFFQDVIIDLIDEL